MVTMMIPKVRNTITMESACALREGLMFFMVEGNKGTGTLGNRGREGYRSRERKGWDAGVLIKRAGSGREMQNATCCHLLMRYDTLKKQEPK